MLGNSERPVASQEGLSSKELISYSAVTVLSAEAIINEGIRLR
jgi:hypothetical protein